MFSTKTADSTLLDNFDSFLETPETEPQTNFFPDNSTLLNPNNDVDMFLGSTVPLDLEMDQSAVLLQQQQQFQHQQQLLQFQQQQIFLQQQAAQLGLVYNPQQLVAAMPPPQQPSFVQQQLVPQQQQSFVQTPYYTSNDSSSPYATTTVVISPVAAAPQQQQQSQASPFVMKKHILRPQKVERIVYNYKGTNGPATTPPSSPPFPVVSHSPTTSTMTSPVPNAGAPTSPFTNHLLVQQLMTNNKQSNSFFSSAPNSPMPMQGSTTPPSPVSHSPPQHVQPQHQQDLFMPQNVTIMENSFGSVKQFYNKQHLLEQRPRSRSCPIPYVQQNISFVPQVSNSTLQMPQQQQQQQQPAMVLVPKPKNVKKRRRTIFATVTPEDEMQFDFKLKKNNF